VEVIEQSTAETGDVAEHNIYSDSTGSHTYHLFTYSVNVYDAALVGTLQPIVRWTDRYGVARQHVPSPPVSVASQVIFSGAVPVWAEAYSSITFEVASVITLGSVGYGYTLSDDFHACQ